MEISNPAFSGSLVNVTLTYFRAKQFDCAYKPVDTHIKISFTFEDPDEKHH